MNRIIDNIRRLNAANVHAEVWDATKKDPAWVGRADLVIADLPCSGLGVLGRKSDIKYRITQDDLDELCKLQRKILSVIMDYVKPGGYLFYSTCTVNPEENRGNVDYILSEGQFVLEEEPVQLLPGGEDYRDGFFYARLRRL